MKAAGLPPPARLRSRADFRRLVQARTISAPCFLVRHRASEQAFARLGLAVSRKVDKRAVGRNRIKRIVRASFRQHRALLPALDLLVVARSAAARADNASLHAELQGLWTRLARLNVDAGEPGVPR